MLSASSSRESWRGVNGVRSGGTGPKPTPHGPGSSSAPPGTAITSVSPRVMDAASHSTGQLTGGQRGHPAAGLQRRGSGSGSRPGPGGVPPVRLRQVPHPLGNTPPHPPRPAAGGPHQEPHQPPPPDPPPGPRDQQ